MLRAIIKSALAHRLRLLLTAVAVMLGVTFVTGTLVYTDTLDEVFSTMVEEGAEGVDVYVQPDVAFESLMSYGTSGPGIPESLVADVQALPEVATAEGSVVSFAQFIDKAGEVIAPMGPPTIGMSWTADPQLASVVIDDGRAPDGPDEVVMDVVTAADHGFVVGDEVEVLLQGPKQVFTLVGTFDRTSGGGFAGATMAAFDLETAQSLFLKEGKVDQIDVAAAPGVTPDGLRSRLEASLDGELTIVTAQDEAAETKTQIRQGFGFFTTVLLVFAAVAVFVGAFIIFNTFSIIVAQRMREFGLLRSLGATHRQVMRSVLVEAALVGLIASVAGILLGLGAAVGLQGLMDAAGVDLPKASLELSSRTIVVSLIVGMGVTLIAAFLPARRAGRVSPVSAMQASTSENEAIGRRRVLIGGGVLVGGIVAMGAGFLSVISELPAVGFGAFLVFMGVAILGPVYGRALASLLASPLPRLFGVTGTLARENSRRAPRRTSSTAAALMVGLALVTLVAMFASSLKGSIDVVLTETVRSDLVVMPQSFTSVSGFTPRIAKQLDALPETATVSPMRYGEWKGSDGRMRSFLAIDGATVGSVFDLKMVSGSPKDLTDGGILLRKNEAEARDVTTGDMLDMTFSNAGEIEVEIDGVFAAEIDDRYLLSLDTYDENFTRGQDIQVHIVGATGIPIPELRAAVERELEPFPNVRVLDQASLREESSKLIDQMLNMVYGLLALALVIAVLGITNTLALSVHERRREVGLLRAVGATRAQVRRMIRWEAATIALFGSVLGILIGSAFATALMKALEEEGFSRIVVPVPQLVTFVLIAGAAGVLAAALPARRAARMDVLEAIAFE
jgi:putative ABC transport system permease protein